MDDAQLWADMNKGAPVAHCRAKIAHEQAMMTKARNDRALAEHDRRRPTLRLRWAA